MALQLGPPSQLMHAKGMMHNRRQSSTSSALGRSHSSSAVVRRVSCRASDAAAAAVNQTAVTNREALEAAVKLQQEASTKESLQQWLLRRAQSPSPSSPPGSSLPLSTPPPPPPSSPYLPPTIRLYPTITTNGVSPSSNHLRPQTTLPASAAAGPVAGSRGLGPGPEGPISFPPAVVRVIATDVDGTLLDSRQQLSERNERAIKMAVEHGIKVILATGKARGPWVEEVLPRLGLDTPGVFMQGLLIYGADGSLLFNRQLRDEVAADIIRLAEDEKLTVVAYCGQRILCAETNPHTDRLIGYGEPVPEAVGSLLDIVGKVPIHKLLFMADDETLIKLRPRAEALMGGRSTLVTALHGMLEFLPPGASKAVGLSQVLQEMGVDPINVMALGDGENDIEMLKMCGFGVAMGNASLHVQGVANHVTKTNDEDGLAQAIERFALPPGAWCWD